VVNYPERFLTAKSIPTTKKQVEASQMPFPWMSLLQSTFLPVLISLPAITSWFKVELAHSGFALRAAPSAAPGKNALFLGPTTVAERLVRACVPFSATIVL